MGRVFKPLVYVPPGKDSNTNRKDDTADIDGLGSRAHLLALLGKETNPTTDKGRNQQFGGDDRGGKSIHQRLHCGERRHGTVTD